MLHSAVILRLAWHRAHAWRRLLLDIVLPNLAVHASCLLALPLLFTGGFRPLAVRVAIQLIAAIVGARMMDYATLSGHYWLV